MVHRSCSPVPEPAPINVTCRRCGRGHAVQLNAWHSMSAILFFFFFPSPAFFVFFSNFLGLLFLVVFLGPFPPQVSRISRLAHTHTHTRRHQRHHCSRAANRDHTEHEQHSVRRQRDSPLCATRAAALCQALTLSVWPAPIPFRCTHVVQVTQRSSRSQSQQDGAAHIAVAVHKPSDSGRRPV